MHPSGGHSMRLKPRRSSYQERVWVLRITSISSQYGTVALLMHSATHQMMTWKIAYV